MVKKRILKIYVSGRSATRNGVESAIKDLQEAGYKISFDWTKFPRFVYSENEEMARKYATLELRAVGDSDVFVLISDKEGTGMYVEMGYALANKIPVYVVGPWNTKPIFHYHPLVRKFKNIEEVIKDLKINDI